MPGELQKIPNIENQKTSNTNNREDFNSCINSFDITKRKIIKDFHSTIKDEQKRKEYEEEIVDNKDDINSDDITLSKKGVIGEQAISAIIAKYIVDEKKQDVDEKKQDVDEKKQEGIKEDINNKNNISELLKDADKYIAEFYRIFGGKDELDRRLGESGVDVEELREKARASVASSNPKLDKNSEEFKSRVEVSFIANNRSEISAVVPEELRPQFDAIYNKVIRSAHSLEVPYVITIDREYNKGGIIIDGMLVSERQAIALSIPVGTEAIRQGGLITFEKDGYQIEINIDERPPSRYIKGDGLEIKVKNDDVRFESRYEFKVKIRHLEGEIRGIKEYLGTNKSKVDSLKLNSKNLEQDYNILLKNYNAGKYVEKNNQGEFVTIDQPAPQNKEMAGQGIKEIYEEIMRSRQEIKTYTEYEKILEQKEKDLIELKKAQQEGIAKFKNAIQERDRIAEDNLKYLVKTHLNIFGDNNIDRIIDLFNKYRTINGNAGARPVNIDEGFRDSDKSIMINGMSKLLGGITYFKNINEPINNIDNRPVDNKFITEKLKSTGVLKKDGVTVDIIMVEKLLSSTTQKQDKQGEDKKPQPETNPQVK